MEKHRCRLCLRNFANGKALGGHMRSHMMNLYVSSKARQEEEEDIDDGHREVSEEIESVPSSTSSEDEDGENGDEGLFSYRLSSEISPKKKIGTVDPPEFCFGAVEAAGSSVVVQDGESETESSKNQICRRSKRVRKSIISDTVQFSGYNDASMKEPQMKKSKSEKQGRFSSELPFVEAEAAEPVSSISDTTPEEDVAYCLMMLSRDKWKKADNEDVQEQEDVYEEEEEEADHEKQEKQKKKDRKQYSHGFGVVKVTKSRTRGKYKCEECNKVFRSYQALGGHRASHKRIKAHISNSTEEPPPPAAAAAAEMEIGDANAAFPSVIEKKIHECPVCYRVFSSGQALGGHKRSHVMGAGAAAAAAIHASIRPSAKPFSRFGEAFIDLNLPAPIDDDDVSQVELSAVSDAEFVNPFKQ